MVMRGKMWSSTERNFLRRWRNIKGKQIQLYKKWKLIQTPRFMATYDDKTLEPTPPVLAPGEKEHVLVPQDECINHTNDGQHCQWLHGKQQPIKMKGNGRGVHICGWISEQTGHLRLSEEQIAAQAKLPPDQQLKVTDSWVIIYPGKGHDDWWDLKQLMAAMVHTIAIFEATHQGKISIFLFDCSSAHEGFAADALEVNKMNINSGGKQPHLQSTTIPLNNPPPKPGHLDTQEQHQTMSYAVNHQDPSLWGQPKGIKAVLQEYVSVWDKALEMNSRKVPVGKCRDCKKSQPQKGAEKRIAEAEAMGQEYTVAEEDLAEAQDPVSEQPNEWCCLYRILLLQADFTNEKPMIQHYIESQGHVCMFLPKFHCKLNPIEMLWGFMKYSKYSHLSVTVYILITFDWRILKVLGWQIHNGKNSCFRVSRHVWHSNHLSFLLEILVVHGLLSVSDNLRLYFTFWFVLQCRKGLDMAETAFAIWVYKSHHKVGSPAEIKALLSQRPRNA